MAARGNGRSEAVSSKILRAPSKTRSGTDTLFALLGASLANYSWRFLARSWRVSFPGTLKTLLALEPALTRSCSAVGDHWAARGASGPRYRKHNLLEFFLPLRVSWGPMGPLGGPAGVTPGSLGLPWAAPRCPQHLFTTCRKESCFSSFVCLFLKASGCPSGDCLPPAPRPPGAMVPWHPGPLMAPCPLAPCWRPVRPCALAPWPPGALAPTLHRHICLSIPQLMAL